MIGGKLKRTIATRTLYVLNFLLGAHIALVVYFNSSFLESRGVPEELLGTLYAIGSVLSIVVLILLPKVLNKIGNYKTLVIAGLIDIVLFVGLALLTTKLAILTMFVLSVAISVPLFFGLDILLESYNGNEENTGDTRSLFLTAINIAFVASPAVAGLILVSNGYSKLYLLSALLVVPFLLITRWQFKDFKDPEYKPLKLKPVFKKLLKSADLRGIFALQFFIRFFFAIMVIYVPIYLTQHIGFSLKEMGTIFSIMLLPFVLLEYPIGHYVDKIMGEKELLFVGFAIMAFSTAAIPMFTTAPNFLFWTLLLLTTRVGAAMVEVMNEIYFFKHVDGDDLDAISSFRILRPMAYIIAPLLGSTLLLINGFETVFLMLAVCMMLGAIIATSLKDTK